MSLSSFFKNDEGKVVIGQWPNTPLWMAVLFFGLQYLPLPIIHTLGFWGLIFSLLYWSFLEITAGESSFRRLLGIIVLMSQISKIIKLLI